MKRCTLLLSILALSAAVSANGAMGLGLEMFDLRYWFAYVAVMVGAEAWLIGRALKLKWGESVLKSMIGNVITGVFCGGMGCLAPFWHQSFVNTPDGPNPF